MALATRTDGDVLAVKVGEVATGAAVPEGIAMQGQGTVGADGEARSDWPLDWVVELKLVVGDDFTGTLVLIGEDTVLEGDDGVGGAHGFSLLRDVVGDVVGSYFKGTGIILITAVGGLT